jgi:hypothetical protein
LKGSSDRGSLHVERLVWAFCVELLDELIKRGLLLHAVHDWCSGGLSLQRQMHALATAILLRVSWLDAFDGDAEAQPPDGQFGEIEQCVGAGERDAVVGSDGVRQAALGEQAVSSRTDSRA